MHVGDDAGAPSGGPRSVRGQAAALTVLRFWVAAVWLSNGLAKLFHVARIDLGFFRAGLIDIDSARSILHHAVATTTIRPLGVVYGWIAGAAWTPFSIALTAAELLIGLALLIGVLTRAAAALGLLLIAPIWAMTWPSGGYLWDYPSDLVPLALLMLAPAGTTLPLPPRRRDG